MCRSKDDPRGYYRCSGYDNHTRRARRAANKLYRDTLADAVAAQGHDDLAARIRRAPYSSMAALTTAAGYHPAELVGGGRVPGMTHNHALTDDDAALVAELGGATGTGASLDLDTREVAVDGELDEQLRRESAAAGRDTYVSAADALPVDPDGAPDYDWDPADMPPEALDLAAGDVVAELRDINRTRPDADERVAELQQRLDAYSRALNPNGADQPDDEMSLEARDRLWDAGATRAAADAERDHLSRYIDMVEPHVTCDDADGGDDREAILNGHMPLGAANDPDHAKAMAAMDDAELAEHYIAMRAAAEEMHGAGELADHVAERPEVAAAMHARGAAVDTYAEAARAELARRGVGEDIAAALDDAADAEGGRTHTGAAAAADAMRDAARELRRGAPVDPDQAHRDRCAALEAYLPPADSRDIPTQWRREDNGYDPDVHPFDVTEHLTERVSDHYSNPAAARGEDAVKALSGDMLRAARALDAEGRTADAEVFRDIAAEVPYLAAQAEDRDTLAAAGEVQMLNSWGHRRRLDGPDAIADAMTNRARDMGLHDVTGRTVPGDRTDTYTSAHVRRDAAEVLARAESAATVSGDSSMTLDDLSGLCADAASTDANVADYVRGADALTGGTAWRGDKADPKRLVERANDRDALSLALARGGGVDANRPVSELITSDFAPLAAISHVMPEAVSAEVDRRAAAVPASMSATAGRHELSGDLYGAGPGDARSILAGGEGISPYVLTHTEDENLTATGALPAMTLDDKVAAADRVAEAIDSMYADMRRSASSSAFPVSTAHGETAETSEADIFEQVHARLWKDYGVAREKLKAGDESQFDRIMVIGSAAYSEKTYYDAVDDMQSGDGRLSYTAYVDPNQQSLF